MQRTSELTLEVFVASPAVMAVAREDIDVLQRRAKENARRTCRLLMHRSVDEPLHEMVIVHTKGRYIRPHKNTNSSKSYHLIAGRLACVLFSEDGAVTATHILGEYSSGEPFMLRLAERCYHTLIPLTETAVFVETILGPFKGTPYAPWAPEEGDEPAAQAYYAQLCEHLPRGVD